MEMEKRMGKRKLGQTEVSTITEGGMEQAWKDPRSQMRRVIGTRMGKLHPLPHWKVEN